MKPVPRDAFPNDDDGEVLFRLASKGIDLNTKREIEFYCYADDEDAARRIAADLPSYGYKSSVYEGDGDGGSGLFSVYLSIKMVPKYELIVLEQKRLDLILEPHKTRCDGWMTQS